MKKVGMKKVGMNKHKVTTEYRYCHPHKLYTNGSHTDSIPCEVQYKVLKCQECKYYEIYQSYEHSIDCEDFIEINPNIFHPEAQIYGIRDDVKEILNDLFDKNNGNIQPAQVEVWCKAETQVKGFRTKDDKWIDVVMNGKPQPTYSQICAYYKQYKIDKNIVSNKVTDVEDLILKHE